MACTEKIAKDITNSCDTVPVAGFEKKGWIINREDLTATLDGTKEALITALALAGGTYAYVIQAVKKENDGGFDLVTADNSPDTFQHFFSFQPYERDAESIQNIDQMNDLVIVCELKGAKTEGCFVVYGLETGLYKSAGTQRVNANNGLPTYTLQSMEGQGERFSRYVFWDTNYATTVAALEALEVP